MSHNDMHILALASTLRVDKIAAVDDGDVGFFRMIAGGDFSNSHEFS